MRLIFLTLLVVVGPAALAEDKTPPAKDEIAALKAENRLLKKQLERQKVQIAELMERLEQLNRPTRPPAATSEPLAGSDAEPLPSTQPARRPVAKRASAPKRVIFIIDGSGSMIDVFPLVKAEVQKGVANLPPGTFFNVLVGADERVGSFDPNPVAASPETLRRFNQFMDELTTTGTSNMLPALQSAIKQRADLVWLVTDGDLPNEAEFMRKLRAANAARRVRINTILVTTQPPEDKAAKFATTLMNIATAHGGMCYDIMGKRVDVDALRATAAKGAISRRNPPGPEPKSVPKGPSIFDIANE